ncbi:MAG: hypothetical protein ACJAVK_000400 [Akkermansiaceae bacterium]|jgi:hypothetical protein
MHIPNPIRTSVRSFYAAHLALWLLVCNSHAQFEISEFLADNSGTLLTDEDGQPSDWIEIQNVGAAAATIAGYHLSDDPTNLSKWTFPDEAIAPGAYLVVYASGKNRTIAGSELHTNFGLNSGGEYLALVAPDGGTVVSSFSPEFPDQYRDISYGIGSGGPLSAATFIEVGAPLTYHVPSAEIGSAWQSPGFDDTTWTAAHSGLGWGYSGTSVGDNIAADGNLEADMKSSNASIFIRIPFQITDPAEVVTLTLKMKMDDGFAAYLNGSLVATSKAPNPLLFNSKSTQSSEVRVGDPFEFFALGFAGALVAGENILAIHGLNDSLSSSDFLVVPELLGEIQDISAGPQPGYFVVSSSGAPNTILSTSPPNLVNFSVTSKAFTEASFPLTLSIDGLPGAMIRYTDDGSLPDDDPSSPSPEYTGPITINGSTLIRARAFITGALPGPGRSEGYLKLASSEANFSSDLPVVLLSTFGAGPPPDSGSTSRKDVFMLIYEPDPATGRTTLTGTPSLSTRGGYRKRGSSSAGFPKYAVSFESWDEFDEDKDIAPLGFTKEADWILNSRYTFDLALMRNPFLYELSNQIGRWAVKTRFVEIYNDVSGSEISSNDYYGVYSFMEKIEPDKGRLDIPGIDPWDNAEPEITGGYVFKKDRTDPGEPTLTVAGMGELVLGDPDGLEITQPQRTYLTGYLNEMNVALGAANGMNTSTGKHFSEYLDVASFIDNFWLNTLAMDPDWGRLSQYFYKDRNGLLNGGPIWDYDRTMGSRDNRDDNPRQWYQSSSATWYDGSYPWFGRLFGFNSNPAVPQLTTTRPDVFQQLMDRWYELRAGQFSKENMNSVIDAMAIEIQESQARNFARWNLNPGSISGQNFAEAGTSGWEREVSHLKGWLEARSEWIDSRFFLPPTLNHPGGVVATGFELTMTSADAGIYYSVDGSDPRAPGGSPSLSAVPFDGGPVDTVLLEANANCQYFVPLDDSLEATWLLLGFDTNTWLTGTSGLGFESNNGTLTSEISTNIESQMQPSANGLNNASCYFRYQFDFDNVANVNSLLMEIKYDDAFVAYLNGTEVARSSSAPATIAWNSDSTSGPSDSNVINYDFNGIADNNSFDYDITAFKAALVNGTNVLAIQGMNSSSGGSDLLIKPRLTVNHTVVATPITLTGTSTVVARTYDGQQWSAPTSATYVVGSELADSSNIVISEIMYNPAPPNASEIDAGFTNSNQFEYIELLNISTSPVNLLGMNFGTGINFDFSGASFTVLPPAGRVLVVNSQAAFEHRYGSGLNNLIAGEFAANTSLASAGERLTLDSGLEVIRDFTYNDQAPWPKSPDGMGPSLVLIAPKSNPDHSVGGNWRASAAASGEPGTGGSTLFVGDPMADNDGDGLSAFAEHAFGTNDSDSGDGSVLQTAVAPDGSLSVTYPVNLAAEDAVVAMEQSTDLVTWTPAAPAFQLENEVHNGDGSATFTFETIAPAAPGSRLFVRLKVTARQ